MNKRSSMFVVSLVMMIVVGLFGNRAFAALAKFSDIDGNAYESSICEMKDLEILAGVGGNKFLPYGKLTREQFATIIVRILDLQLNANMNKSKSVFSDVEIDRWSVGYINEAYAHNLITGKTDGLFYPEENITLGQVCTILVKTLGYTDDDLIGVWPNNYVNKANDLDITKNMSISPFSEIRRDQMAYILDNFLNTNIKGSNVTVAKKYGIYLEDIIVGNVVTNENLKNNQIITAENGILDKKGGVYDTNLGERYDLVIKNNVVVKAIKLNTKVESIEVYDYKDGKVSYRDGNKIKSMVLSEKNTYYHDGVMMNFSQLENVIKKNSVLICTYNNKNNIEIDSVIVVDPVYSAPHVVNDNIDEDGKLKDFDLKGVTILKDGKYINKDELENRDVVYSIQTYLGKNSYYEAIHENIQGELTNILPNKLTPSQIEVDNVVYNLSKYMPLSKLTNRKDGYNISDKVCVVFGHDGKVVDILDKGIKSGKYQKLRILGDSRSVDIFEHNQVLTEKGVYYVLDNLGQLDLGAKYEAIVDGDTIVKIGEKEKDQLEITVRNVDGQKITYGNNEVMLLPSRPTYYYNGSKIEYKNVAALLTYDSSLIFVYNETRTGFEYAIVVDPLYTRPEFVVGFNPYLHTKVGSISFDINIPVVINKEGEDVGETTDIYDIGNNTVMYKISDYWGKNEYLLILNTQVSGIIEEFIPSRLNVNSLKISTDNGYETYKLSEYFDINLLTNSIKLNLYKKGTPVKLYLDKDNKIMYME